MNKITIPSENRIIFPSDARIIVEPRPIWTPTKIATTAWYDAQDLSTITFGSGTKVSQWRDKSGNNKHTIQNASAQQPTYIASDPKLGNMPSIFALQDATIKGLNQTSATTIKRVYFVCYYRDGVTNTRWTNHNCIFSSTDSNVRLTGRANDIYVWDGPRASQNFDYYTGPYVPNNLPTTFRNGSTTSTTAQLNGLPMPATMFRVESSSTHTKTWRLFNNGASFSTFDGGIGEILFTTGSENLATQQKVEGYLAWKWGIVSKLPSNHPYKDQRPLA